MLKNETFRWKKFRHLSEIANFLRTRFLSALQPIRFIRSRTSVAWLRIYYSCSSPHTIQTTSVRMEKEKKEKFPIQTFLLLLKKRSMTSDTWSDGIRSLSSRPKGVLRALNIACALVAQRDASHYASKNKTIISHRWSRVAQPVHIAREQTLVTQLAQDRLLSRILRNNVKRKHQAVKWTLYSIHFATYSIFVSRASNRVLDGTSFSS